MPITAKDKIDRENMDIVDEALDLFRTLMMFQNFKVKGGADKVIVYLNVFLAKCLETMRKLGEDCDRAKAKEKLEKIVKDPISITDKDFYMNKLGLIGTGGSSAKLSQFLDKARAEACKRLLSIMYDPETGDLDRKYWIQYGNRTFLGQKYNTKFYHV